VTPNQLGQMYALTVLTPVDPGRVHDVEAILAGLPRRPSPFARVRSVHFARWVMMLDFLSDPSQPAPQHLPAPYLLLSATFDGSLDDFLAELTTQLPDETEAIYRCCIGAPEPARGAPLHAYLRHNQVETGLFFSAYPDATVETVMQALNMRQQVINFGVAAQGMSPEDLLNAFRREF
jgi:hypothetical protein